MDIKLGVRRWAPLSVATGAAIAGVALLFGAASSGSAQAPGINIPLSGAEEVPAVETTASGRFTATLGGGSLDGELRANGTALTMAHIHLGAKGANGPVVAFLFGPDATGVNAIHQSVSVTPDKLLGPLAGNWQGFVNALRRGELYVNVHSVANPPGVIRGQIPGSAAPGAPNTGSGSTLSGSSDWAQPAGAALIGLAIGAVALGFARRRPA
ncbi:MAG: CHRD domain-containing protein [Dehalococcoidia bacterium]